jgi:hypothetical protein
LPVEANNKAVRLRVLSRKNNKVKEIIYNLRKKTRTVNDIDSKVPKDPYLYHRNLRGLKSELDNEYKKHIKAGFVNNSPGLVIEDIKTRKKIGILDFGDDPLIIRSGERVIFKFSIGKRKLTKDLRYGIFNYKKKGTIKFFDTSLTQVVRVENDMPVYDGSNNELKEITEVHSLILHSPVAASPSGKQIMFNADDDAANISRPVILKF